MKDEMDDYLWDGTGEADPEVERLEMLLGRFRGDAPAPVMPTVPLAPQRPQRPYLPALVAAAALVVVGFGSGLWMMFGGKPAVEPRPVVGGPPPTQTVQPGPIEPPIDDDPKIIAGATPEGKQPSRKPRTGPKTLPEPQPETTTVAHHTGPKPLFDFETASHIEQTELLLRSFMNAKADEGTDATQIAYEKQRSRELLDRNVLLRLGAEAKGNFPTEDVLGSVEPYLLDIANLNANAPADQVRAIQERLQKREIVADLQIYAMNGPRVGF
jgi:hypothetical protein